MRKIAIVGGKLQGLEVCYLGKKANIHVTLIDTDENAPAKNLCDQFVCGDVLGDDPQIRQVLESVDMVLPTLENDHVLSGLEQLSHRMGFTLAFDPDAYRISSSKKLSDDFFHLHEVATPRYYPQGDGPYIAKPDHESGSHGIRYFDSREEVEEYLESAPERMIVQEYLEGPSYSIEVMGFPGNYRTYEITQIHMAEDFDCKMVTAPCDPVTRRQADDFARMAVDVASLLNLKGIMDLEVIDHRGELKLLEIDARFPSQTPSVVYHTSGMNLLEEIYDIYATGVFQKPYPAERYYSSFSHHLWDGEEWKEEGEHIMVEGYPLEYAPGRWGALDVISDYREDRDTFRVTLIQKAETEELLEKNRTEVWKCLRNIR
ncbi:MAG: 3-methylornithine--L-lysine ligase PylC [Anaerovoracaceae bacterium]|jgi:pyrrolysine biosynthesis protein PylC